ncbi:hypothetical protein [Nocardia pseudovaccinii]|uniref:hypothetical protein n=1 Tax=Nocardia pseudovaccinii TaxID=189540 RepID=UPI0012F49DEC|nr:hypothetical protein [Nocardia pseudovaccinii]
MTGEPARPFRRMLLLAVVVVLAVGGAATRPFSWQATVLVAVPVIVVSELAFRSRPEQIPPTVRLRRGVVVWSTLLVVASVWEVYAFVRQPDWTRASELHPTLSTLLDPALEQLPLRLAGWLVWLGAGWWLVSR